MSVTTTSGASASIASTSEGRSAHDRDDLDVGLGRQDLLQAFSHEEAVVCEHHPDRHDETILARDAEQSCLHPRRTPAGVIAAAPRASEGFLGGVGDRSRARKMGQPQRTRERSTVGVVTVDDQAVFREVAREVIEATDGFESLGEAGSGEEALRLADEVDPDLVLVDVRMPGMNGVETASRLAAAHPKATIVLVSSEDRSALPTGAESCGAAALLCKEEFGTGALRRLWALHGPGSARSALQ